MIAKTDYAASGGGVGGGATGCDLRGSPGGERNCPDMTGIIFRRSDVGTRQVEDGTTNTYLFGEKFMGTEMYTNGVSYADNGPMYTGHDKDTLRHATRLYPPLQDHDGGGDLGYRWQNFRSAHPGGLHMAFCDGSVHTINYWIDPMVHHAMGNRNDRTAVDPSQLKERCRSFAREVALALIDRLLDISIP